LIVWEGGGEAERNYQESVAGSSRRKSWIFVSPVASFVLSASMRRRKCTRPDSSPATIIRPSGVTAQLFIVSSPVKTAISCPLSKSQSRSVRSHEAERARRPSGVTATAEEQRIFLA